VAQPLRVAVAGAGGRMGRMLIEGVLADPVVQLCAALELPTSPLLGQDAAGFFGRVSGVAITSDVAAATAASQVLIDFTRPEGTLAHLQACRQSGTAAVIGTTGFTPEQKALLAAHGQALPLVWAPNMSIGVNVVLQLLAQAAVSLGEGYDVEVLEAHHRHKVDAPSGTALAMGEAVAHASGRQLGTHGVFTRHGHTGERVPGSIGFATLRGGDLNTA
jgi:4-hydroxy-tetrahydrodipicolinate reductase